MRTQLTLLLLALALSSASVFAQTSSTSGTISGRVLDRDDNLPLEGVSVKLRTLPDSTFVGGASTDSLGRFTVKNLAFGRYATEILLTGFSAAQKDIQLSAQSPAFNFGDVILMANDIMLNEVLVTTNVVPVTVKEDTVMYNANAFRLPEGSMLEDLIKRLPGAEIDSDGNLTINGKTIPKVLMDGKEFFSDDPKVALKNLPANMINTIKAYERKSDFTRQTGIDDGNEEYILDLQSKPGMKQGWVGNIALGKGSEDRYNTTLNANRFRDDSHFSIVSGANNINNSGFGEFGGSGRGNFGGGGGVTASKNIGVSLAKDFSETLKVSGDFRYSHSSRESSSRSISETQYGDSIGTFRNSMNRSNRVNNEFNFNFRVEWKPDTLTTITFRPRISTSDTKGDSYSESTSQRWESKDLVNATPDMRDPVDTLIHGIPAWFMRQNDNRGNDESKDKSFSAGGQFSLVRRLNAKGRNVSVNVNYTWSERSSDDYSYSDQTYWQRAPTGTFQTIPYIGDNGQPYDYYLKQYNRFNDGYNKSLNLSAGASYSEPLWSNETRRGFLQFNYSYNYRKTNSSRYGYDYNYANDPQNIGGGIGNWNAIDWSLVNDSIDLSSVYENIYSSHNMEISMRQQYYYTDTLGRQQLRSELSYGVTFIPQHSETNNIYGPNMYRGLVEQDVVNWSPTLRYRYRFNPQSTLQLNYRGRSNAPNVDNLQEVISKTNPQYLRYGNPALKPSFSHNVNVNFNSYNRESRKSYNANGGFNSTQNTTATKVLNDRGTGTSVSKVVNMSGNWNMNAGFGFNTPLDSKNRFNISLNTSFNYSENKSLENAPLLLGDQLASGGYQQGSIKQILYENGVDSTRLNSIHDVTDLPTEYIDLFPVSETKTMNLGLGQRISLSYMNDWLDFRINGSVNYRKVESNMQSVTNRETYDYRAGASAVLTLPWSFSLSTDINYTHRDGYAAGLRNNEKMWNAQISKSFMSNNAALIRLNIYDILREQTNVSRNISAITITDTESNTLGAYWMLSFTYRFNTLGGMSAFGGGRGQGGMRMGGFGGGGFGGGGRGNR